MAFSLTKGDGTCEAQLLCQGLVAGSYPTPHAADPMISDRGASRCKGPHEESAVLVAPVTEEALIEHVSVKSPILQRACNEAVVHIVATYQLDGPSVVQGDQVRAGVSIVHIDQRYEQGLSLLAGLNWAGKNCVVAGGVNEHVHGQGVLAAVSPIQLDELPVTNGALNGELIFAPRRFRHGSSIAPFRNQVGCLNCNFLTTVAFEQQLRFPIWTLEKIGMISH